MTVAPSTRSTARSTARPTRIRLTDEQKRAIRALHGSRSRAVPRLLAFLGIWGGAALVALRLPWLPLQLACWFLAGASIQGLGILMHEASHGNLFRNRTLNDVVGFLCGIPALLAITPYRRSHMTHHQHARGPDDPDELENLSRNPRTLSLIFLFILLAGDLYGFYFVGPLAARRGSTAERLATLTEYGVIAGVIVGAFVLVPFHVMLYAWVLPVLFARQLTNVRTLAEHSLTRGGSRWLSTRTVVSNRFVSFFMCNVNYHIEHHVFPRVPFHNIPRVHALLESDLERIGAHVCPSYGQFLLQMLRFALRAWRPGGASVPLVLPT